MSKPPAPPSAPPQPVLPVITNNAQTQHPIAPPAFRAIISHLSETIQNGLVNRRPWGELIDRNAFAKPDSLTEASLRIRKNYTYFCSNYLSLVAIFIAMSLLTNPFSLILLVALLAAWIFLYPVSLVRPALRPHGTHFFRKRDSGDFNIAYYRYHIPDQRWICAHLGSACGILVGLCAWCIQDCFFL